MRLRSLLFVPGDRPDRMDKALRSGADALILDLEDAVAPSGKPEARRNVAEFLNANSTAKLWVRINPLGTDEADKDLAAILSSHPDGIVLPKAEGGFGRGSGAAVTSPAMPPPNLATPPILRGDVPLGSTAGPSGSRPDLGSRTAAAVGRRPARARRALPPPYGGPLALPWGGRGGRCPIETGLSGFRDLDGLAAYAARARRDGFTGMMAIHPDQVPVINAAFTPSEAEVAHARAVVAAFAAQPGAGALSLDGRMIDRPHLVQAQRTLAAAAGQ